MSAVRLRRLTADYEKLWDYVRRHPRLRLVQSDGDPPEAYQIEYKLKSVRQVDDKVTVAKSHTVEIVLPRNYPRTPPQCRMLSPIFHPNIAPHAICIGDHWSAGEPLWSIIARIGEMIAYQSYNTKSPLNGEAARWVDDKRDRLPLDPVSMLVEEADDDPDDPPSKHSTSTSNAEEADTYALATETPAPPKPAKRPKPRRPVQRPAPEASQAPKRASTPPPLEEPIIIQCTGCAARLKLKIRAKRVRCRKCQTLINVPAQ